MFRIAVVYGAISGSIIIAVMVAGIYLNEGAHGTGTGGELFGYTVMLVAMVMIFVGTKRYRDEALGGVIRFGPAFGLGLCIAAVAGVFYVIGWEISLAATNYTFAEEYAQAVIAAREAEGVSAAELDRISADMRGFVEQYRNPLIRIPMTFIEIFPVGVLVALVSAAVLRNPKVLPAK